jgi:hypothetical protein
MYRAYRGKGCHFSPKQLITVSVVPQGLAGARYVTPIRAAALLDAFA